MRAVYSMSIIWEKFLESIFLIYSFPDLKVRFTPENADNFGFFFSQTLLFRRIILPSLVNWEWNCSEILKMKNNIFHVVAYVCIPLICRTKPSASGVTSFDWEQKGKLETAPSWRMSWVAALRRTRGFQSSISIVLLPGWDFVDLRRRQRDQLRTLK